MREAALEIARQSDDFSPSIADAFIDAIGTRLAQANAAFKLARLHRTLERLDDHQLKDIGVTRAEIYRHTGRTEATSKTASRLSGKLSNCGWQCAGR